MHCKGNLVPSGRGRIPSSLRAVVGTCAYARSEGLPPTLGRLLGAGQEAALLEFLRLKLHQSEHEPGGMGEVLRGEARPVGGA